MVPSLTSSGNTMTQPARAPAMPNRKRTMKKILHECIGKRDVHWFVFGLALVLFNWPFLTIVLQEDIRTLYRFLFGGWIALIALVHFIARCIEPDPPTDRETRGADDV